MAEAGAHNPDVIVVGAGLIGCAIALRLAQAKLRVTVFERGEPGCEASSAGAGMIAPQGETTEADEYYEFCAASRDLYPDFAAEVEALTGRDVGFRRDGTLMAALDEAQAADLDRVYENQKAAGLPVERLSPGEARRHAPGLSEEARGALLMPNDFRVDNEKLIKALAAACARSGVLFRLHSTVTGFDSRNGRVETIEVREGAKESRHTAGTFVLAAGAWSADLAASSGTPMPVTPCRGQLMEFEGAQDFPLTLRAGHYYLVPRSEGRLVAGSTMEYAGFEKAVTGDGLRSVLEGAIGIAPCVRQMRFVRAWAGFRPDTLDHRPILGCGELENLVFATGHFRNGILLTPLTAKLISELIISGHAGPMLAPYAPRRFGTSTSGFGIRGSGFAVRARGLESLSS
ncbi:MAG: glycine oxidase ThiO [Terriglobia bacterium]